MADWPRQLLGQTKLSGVAGVTCGDSVTGHHGRACPVDDRSPTLADKAHAETAGGRPGSRSGPQYRWQVEDNITSAEGRGRAFTMLPTGSSREDCREARTSSSCAGPPAEAVLQGQVGAHLPVLPPL